MLKRVLGWTAAAAVISGAGFLMLSWRPAIAPVNPPASDSFSPDAVRRGAVVASEGFCAECHTRRDGTDGPALAGDFRMQTPFGTFYAPNITPDPETGIGRWSQEAFKRALRSGISRNGAQLYPVFPFDHFTHMTDQDIDDLYAWIMSQPAVHLKPRKNDVAFPFNFRPLQEGWKILYLRKGPLALNPEKSEEWNRGFYLAEGASHCGSCHTPRNLLGAEKSDAPYAGAVVDGWIAPPLDKTNPAPVSWTQDQLYDYIARGRASLHGVAAGPMAPVAHFYHSVPAEDAQAVAAYFADSMHDDSAKNVAQIESELLTKAHELSQGALYDTTGERLFSNACAACHGNVGAIAPHRPELALSTALWLDEPDNLFQIMLRGLDAETGELGTVMPSFYQALNDKELAQIAAYLRSTRTDKAPWTDLEAKAAAVRQNIALERATR